MSLGYCQNNLNAFLLRKHKSQELQQPPFAHEWLLPTLHPCATKHSCKTKQALNSDAIFIVTTSFGIPKIERISAFVFLSCTWGPTDRFPGPHNIGEFLSEVFLLGWDATDKLDGIYDSKPLLTETPAKTLQLVWTLSTQDTKWKASPMLQAKTQLAGISSYSWVLSIDSVSSVQSEELGWFNS